MAEGLPEEATAVSAQDKCISIFFFQAVLPVAPEQQREREKEKEKKKLRIQRLMNT